jgi:hypothetical protein
MKVSDGNTDQPRPRHYPIRLEVRLARFDKAEIFRNLPKIMTRPAQRISNILTTQQHEDMAV